MDLESDRLIYRQLTEADYQLYLTMATNGAVMRYITGKSLTNFEARERFKSMIDCNEKYSDFGFYTIRHKMDRSFVGLGKLVVINEKVAEIGYSLLPDFWGNKYATEIAGLFIDYAKNTAAILELIAFVNPQNIASKKLLAKYGFSWLETGFLNEQPTEIHQLKILK